MLSIVSVLWEELETGQSSDFKSFFAVEAIFLQVFFSRSQILYLLWAYKSFQLDHFHWNSIGV